METKIIYYNKEYELLKSNKLEIIYHSGGSFEFTIQEFKCISNEDCNIFRLKEVPFGCVYYSLDSLFKSLYDNYDIKQFIFKVNVN